MGGPEAWMAEAVARMFRAMLTAGRLTPIEARGLLESERAMLAASPREALLNSKLDRVAEELRLPPPFEE